ncbi:hypothetical protein FOCG_18475 [Fusarium oxysporum f. sp. radicis-lycopersici 26381]|nr:hypothetical protein FOCG_18475 [Fusarium oxysporum f. sp. radicis-lycopersici 26381]
MVHLPARREAQAHPIPRPSTVSHMDGRLSNPAWS